jgi:hypothetical protein
LRLPIAGQEKGRVSGEKSRAEITWEAGQSIPPPPAHKVMHRPAIAALTLSRDAT